MKYIINIENLVKKYKFCEKPAVDNVSFKVKEGEFFAFLGINGAGKSTTINIISTLLKPTSGKITIDGLDLIKDKNQIKKILGIVFQNSVLDNCLTIKDNILIRTSFYKMQKLQVMERFNFLLRKFSLIGCENKLYGKLSGGQKRKCDIIRALIYSPKILILDEPTTGLDPASRIQLWQIIKELRDKENLTVFLTTHYMEEAEVAQNIAIIENGKIIAINSPSMLKNEYSSDELKILVKNNYLAVVKKILSDRKLTYCINSKNIIVYFKNSYNSIEILNLIKDYIETFEVTKGNMDTAFINCLNKGQKLCL